MSNFKQAALVINEARAQMNKGAELDEVYDKFAEGTKLAEGDSKLTAMGETGQAEVELQRKSFSKAFEHTEKAVAVIPKIACGPKTICRAKFMQGMALCGLQKFDEASKFLEDAKQTAETGKLAEIVLSTIKDVLTKAKDSEFSEDQVVDVVKTYNSACSSTAQAPGPLSDNNKEEQTLKRKIDGHNESETPEKKARDEKTDDKCHAIDSELDGVQNTITDNSGRASVASTA